jgi:hypothetical protein
MLHHPIQDDESFDSALLALLTCDHDGLWSLAELARTMGSSSQPADPETQDAIERLHADGLIHRVGDFVFASRAAHAAQRLAG